MVKKNVDLIDINVKMKTRFVPYNKRTISKEMDKFCAECDERFTQLSKEILDHDGLIQVEYWLEGDAIDCERKIRIERKGKYTLHIDWSECDKKVIEEGQIYRPYDNWFTLPTYIKFLFVDDFVGDFSDGIEKPPTYRLLENGCRVSFSKLKCRNAISWYLLPYEMTTDKHLSDSISLDSKRSYESISMTDIASVLESFAEHVFYLEKSINTNTCIGLNNLPLLRREFSDICGRDAKYQINEGYYLCEDCMQEYQDFFCRIKKIK